jgi:type I restriction enzyme M protein
MPAAKKKVEALPSTMKELKDTLWKAADKLRGSMDASQYKDVILGLVFLKYVSDAFAERRQQIHDELAADGWEEAQIAGQLDDVDEYTGNGVFWVPPNARWSYLAEHAKGLPAAMGQAEKPVGELVDDAMVLIMGANQSLNGTLPVIYNKQNVDARRLGELLDLFNTSKFTGTGATKARDLLGEVYEYFLGKFAAAEGRRAGEFYTPPPVVRVLVEVLEPDHGRVYDPCCGSGGMFVQTEKFLAAHQRDGSDISVYGQESNDRTWGLARMNLAIHGLNGNLGPVYQDTFARDLHPELSGDNGADFILANPPFNQKDWARNVEDPRWKFGIPPATNANYAWFQHIISKLAPGGQAGVVMANGSMASTTGGEGGIRAQLVEADLISCVLALPTQLFRSTGIAVCIWFFSKDKGKRAGEILFIDARDMGYMIDRAERALSSDDIARIAGTFHAWRGVSGGAKTYTDEPGFCATRTLAQVKAGDYVVTPGRYVGSADVAETSAPLEETLQQLTGDLLAELDRSDRQSNVLRGQLARLVSTND